jgi:hypothetical protein
LPGIAAKALFFLILLGYHNPLAHQDNILASTFSKKVFYGFIKTDRVSDNHIFSAADDNAMFQFFR